MYRDATPRITKADLQGTPKKKRHGTRSPLKDLARISTENMCEMFPDEHWDVRLTLPIKILSESNRREHWAVANKHKKIQQDVIKTAWIGFNLKKHLPAYLFSAPFKVKLTRIAPQQLDEDDNLPRGFKGCRDMIASLLGVDDGDTHLIKFEYSQDKQGKDYAVRIEIRGSTAV